MECLSYTVHVYLTIVQVSSQAHIHQPPPDRTKEEFAFILYEYNVFTFTQLESMEKKKVKTVTWGKKKKSTSNTTDLRRVPCLHLTCSNKKNKKKRRSKNIASRNIGSTRRETACHCSWLWVKTKRRYATERARRAVPPSRRTRSGTGVEEPMDRVLRPKAGDGVKIFLFRG